MRAGIARAILAAVLVVASALGGWSWCKYRTERGLAEEVQRLEQDRAELQRRLDEKAETLARTQGQQDRSFDRLREEAREREDEEPDAECFGTADVQLLNRAAAGGGPAEVSGQPPGEVPDGAPDAGERQAE